MNRTLKERQRKRRLNLIRRWEYLVLKMSARTLMVLGYGATSTVATVTLLYILCILCIVLVHSDWFGPLATVFFGIVGGLLCVITWGAFRIAHAVKKQSDTLVPPVIDLPDDEFLVRGSDQPTAAPGELLRAARAGQVDPSQELLRANGKP